jgi:hypothetical protein
MKQIDSWRLREQLTIAESKGGVLAALSPFDTLMRHEIVPWPPPEVLQKLYASDRWQGKTPADDEAVKRALGHYCDLQSLNSEDAITWSFFGALVYGTGQLREAVANSLLEELGEGGAGGPVHVWLWRRIPHPEKPASNGGPEIDFGIQTSNALILGEAKWNSGVGKGQGIDRNRSQVELREQFCLGLGLKALTSRRAIVLAVTRDSGVVADWESGEGVSVRSITWHRLAELYPQPLRASLLEYVEWKNEHSVRR